MRISDASVSAILGPLHRSLRGASVVHGGVRFRDAAPSPEHYGREFGSLDLAFQRLFNDERNRARQEVHDQIRSRLPDVLSHADFLVLDRKLTLSVQPAVPVPHGYESYWPLRCDTRPVIDLTLGVLLSEPADFEILGFVALPRLVAGSKPMRLTTSSLRTELFGRQDLRFLEQLI